MEKTTNNNEVNTTSRKAKAIIRKIKEDRDEILKLQEDASNNISVSRRSVNEEIFVPKIHAEDDLLTTIVKKLIIKEEVSLRELLPKFGNSMKMSNYKRALTLSNTMSFAKFEDWMDILGYSYQLKIKKNGSSSKGE